MFKTNITKEKLEVKLENGIFIDVDLKTTRDEYHVTHMYMILHGEKMLLSIKTAARALEYKSIDDDTLLLRGDDENSLLELIQWMEGDGAYYTYIINTYQEA